MKKLIFVFYFFALLSCGSNNQITEISTTNIVTGETAINYANTITKEDLKTHLYIIASDEFEGRETGEPGQKKAAEYIKNFYINRSIPSPFLGDDYFQEIPTDHLKQGIKPSENVLAYIKGSEKPDEIVVISTHYDHLGIKNGEIYNGADDDGSGTVAVMEIAEAFQKAVENGNGPKRSILFLHVTGEEKGLLGSKYYTNAPVFPLINTVVNLNIDMIGRVDDEHENKPNFVYLIGSDKLSSELHLLSEEINNKFSKLILDYKYNDEKDPNRFYYRSDHYNFAKNNIPIIFYFNGTHQDYHRPSDTPDKINYELLTKRSQFIFYTAWEIANREHRIIVDK
jgi:Zn-dependent M28 family amino/carboxypeptidase